MYKWSSLASNLWNPGLSNGWNNRIHVVVGTTLSWGNWCWDRIICKVLAKVFIKVVSINVRYVNLLCRVLVYNHVALIWVHFVGSLPCGNLLFAQKGVGCVPQKDMFNGSMSKLWGWQIFVLPHWNLNWKVGAMALHRVCGY
jgi:hypothetical protein